MSDPSTSRRAFVLRARLLCALFIFVALLLIVRLYFVQIVDGAAYRQEATSQYTSEDPGIQPRDAIYFTTKDGTLVAGAIDETGFTLAIDPEVLADAASVYAKLNSIVPIDETSFMASAAKTSDPYEEVAYHLNDDQAANVQALGISGVILASDEWRTYPGGQLAAQVLGFAGYPANGTVKTGIYGLEKEYNSTLTEAGSGLDVNPFAEIFANLESALSSDPAAHQGSIITSIEPTVEGELESELNIVMQKYTPEYAGGIIMDPHTGEIVAMAQRPTFDPNTYGNATDPSVYNNILVSGRFELGSIMKPLTMTAGIDSGAITASTTYNDTGCITVSGAQVCNYDLKPRGVIPMQQILSQSLNVGASWVATHTGYPTFTKYMKSYFSQQTGIDLPNEVSADLSNLDNGSGPAVNFDTASFGQGISVSPIEMIRAISAIANGGVMPDPHVVTAIKYDDGITRAVPVAQGERVFSTSTATTVDHMLEIVYDYAEGNGIYYMPHYTAGAKTGTAQIPKPGGGYYPDGVFLHSFFGYVPGSDPRFVVFLFAYEPHGVEYASDTLGPIYYQIEQFLINYYNIPPDR